MDGIYFAKIERVYCVFEKPDWEIMGGKWRLLELHISVEVDGTKSSSTFVIPERQLIKTLGPYYLQNSEPYYEGYQNLNNKKCMVHMTRGLIDEVLSVEDC